MTKLKSIYSKRFEIGFVSSLIILTIFALLLSFFSLFLQAGSMAALTEILSESGLILFILNFLPVLILLLFIFYALGSCMISVSAVGFFVIVLCVINYYKIVFRHEPLMPWDFLLIAEFVGIAQSIDSMLFILAGVGIIMGIVLFAHLILFLPTRKIKKAHRIIALVFLAAIAAVINFGLYNSDEINWNLYIKGNPYDDVARVNSHGFVYSFLYNLNKTRITAPSSYNKHEIDALIDTWPVEQPDAEKLPHIVMIMGETFSDIFNNINFDYSEHLNPLKYFSELKRDSVSGYIVTPRVGGGTSDTEFDVLTGIATRHFLGAPYSYSLIRKPLSGLPSLFSSLGYKNIAIHPGQPWFYNRENVYEYLGFDEAYFIESFDEIGSKKGMYISEEATISEVITKFKQHTESSDAPLFEFCITIQNHGPFYVNYKAEQNFNTTADLTNDEILSLSNYLEGLADADFQLNALAEFLKTFPEPVVLVYFGDHIPGFPDNIYADMLVNFYSDTYQLTRLNRTPFLIWQNDASKEQNKFSAEKTQKYNNLVMSSNFLGVALLDLLGFVKADPYFDFVKTQVLPNYPVIFDNWYITAADVPQNERWYPVQALKTMKSWEYYKLFVEKAP